MTGRLLQMALYSAAKATPAKAAVAALSRLGRQHVSEIPRRSSLLLPRGDT